MTLLLISIRNAAHEDVDALVRLDEYAVVANERVDEIRAAVSSGNCWCAVVDAEIVGYRIDSRAFFHRPFLEIVMVKRGARRMGVALQLISHLCHANGSPVFSSCNVSNVPAQRMLTSAGFRVCGYIDGLDEGDPEVVYRL